MTFDLKSSIIENSLCKELDICIRNLHNVYWPVNDNFLDLRIYDNDLSRLE